VAGTRSRWFPAPCSRSVTRSDYIFNQRNWRSVNLTNLGINVNHDGTLRVDSGALSAALSSNFSGVRNFLQSGSTGFSGT